MSFIQTLAQQPHVPDLLSISTETKSIRLTSSSFDAQLLFPVKLRAAWAPGEGEPVWTGVSPNHSSIAPHKNRCLGACLGNGGGEGGGVLKIDAAAHFDLMRL